MEDFTTALQLVLQVTWPFLGAAFIGAAVLGVVRGATQIDDDVITFSGKLLAVIMAIFIFGNMLFLKIVAFTEDLWRNL